MRALRQAIGRSVFARAAARRPSVLIAFIIGGLMGGLAYRLAFDPEVERTLPRFLRSGLNGVGVGLTIWAILTAAGVGGPVGAALRRLPLAVEVLLRAVVMTVALLTVGLILQFALYGAIQLGWVTSGLLRIVAISFGFSMIVGVVLELERLIGGPLLMSALLGVYHRPTRRRQIVMFLDMANSTRLAETMGEVRVHDLITRFFFDIDGPIADYGGAVHAYVGDEVIVSWPLGDDPARNARCLFCFEAIVRRMEALGPSYAAEFGVVPTFRAGIHAGAVVVSECGDAKRQLAFFGDTMNVAARLCDYCKTIGARLVISGDLARQMTVPTGVSLGEPRLVDVRGRSERVESQTVRFDMPARRVRRPF
jgi:class 3 adenylate cyclase